MAINSVLAAYDVPKMKVGCRRIQAPQRILNFVTPL